MPTNDHTVPQKYLRRFAELRSGKGNFTTAVIRSWAGLRAGPLLMP